jgi:hypothetical protein
MTLLVAYLAGFGVVLAYLAVCLVVQKNLKFWLLAEGQDGRLSTSKAQWQLWTVTVAVSYVVIYVARAIKGDHSALSTVPQNVLIALGFSTVTMATAKGMTTFFVASGRTPKPQAGSTSQGGLLQDDTGATDLSKTQLLIWTLIAVSLFFVSVVYQVGDISHKGATPGNSGLPDIDNALLVLSGLAQGGYLGKKLVTAGYVQISTVLPTSLQLAVISNPAILTVFGSGFGDPPTSPRPRSTAGPAAAPVPPGCAVLADGYQCPIDAWGDTKITFHLAASHPSLAPLVPVPPAQTPEKSQVGIQISVVVAGMPGVDGGPITVSA